MNKLVEQVRKKNLSALIPNPEHLLSDIDSRIRRDASTQLLMSGHEDRTITTMIFNEANVSVEERSRLYVRRLGFCNSKLLTRMTNDPDNGTLPKLIQLNEDSPINDAAKFKKRTHGRTPNEISMGRPCWF